MNREEIEKMRKNIMINKNISEEQAANEINKWFALQKKLEKRIPTTLSKDIKNFFYEKQLDNTTLLDFTQFYILITTQLCINQLNPENKKLLRKRIKW